MVTQKSVACTKFCHRVLFSLGEVSEPECVEVMLESDSSSALELIQALDLPKRCRHGQVESGKVKIRHRPGLENIADLFTKCLPSRASLRHRTTHGFLTMDAPLNDLLASSVSPNKRALAVVELCCREGSHIQKACATSGIRYCGVTKDVPLKGVVLQVKRFIEEQKLLGCWVHMHISTPCTSGSPSPLDQVTWTDTGFTNRKLARGILNGAKASRTELRLAVIKCSSGLSFLA